MSALWNIPLVQTHHMNVKKKKKSLLSLGKSGVYFWGLVCMETYTIYLYIYESYSALLICFFFYSGWKSDVISKMSIFGTSDQV